jgi:hypothetical protein
VFTDECKPLDRKNSKDTTGSTKDGKMDRTPVWLGWRMNTIGNYSLSLMHGTSISRTKIIPNNTSTTSYLTSKAKTQGQKPMEYLHP